LAIFDDECCEVCDDPFFFVRNTTSLGFMKDCNPTVLVLTNNYVQRLNLTHSLLLRSPHRKLNLNFPFIRNCNLSNAKSEKSSQSALSSCDVSYNSSQLLEKKLLNTRSSQGREWLMLHNLSISIFAISTDWPLKRSNLDLLFIPCYNLSNAQSENHYKLLYRHVTSISIYWKCKATLNRKNCCDQTGLFCSIYWTASGINYPVTDQSKRISNSTVWQRTLAGTWNRWTNILSHIVGIFKIVITSK